MAVNQFAPGPPTDALPSAFKSCITASRYPSGPATARCTGDIVGSVYGPAPEPGKPRYCARPEWKDTQYCSCVNSNIPGMHAFCGFAPCVNDPYAFVPGGQYAVVKGGHCPDVVTCAQVTQAGGDNNIVGGVQQQQCGRDLHGTGSVALTSVAHNMMQQLKANPKLVLIVFIVLVGAAVLIGISTRRHPVRDHHHHHPPTSALPPGAPPLPPA